MAWAALGAVAAGAYARLGLKMGFGPPLVMTAMGGMTLVLVAGALWRVIDPLTRDEVRLPLDVRAPHRIRELEREKQVVLKAIKEIELDYQMRKISEPDYREMIERYRTRALRVMGDLAAGDDYRVLIERELKGRLAALVQVEKATATATAVVVPAAGATKSAAGDVAKNAAPLVATPIALVTDATPNTNCPHCSTPNDADARFCKHCGKPTSPSAPVPS